MTLFVPRGYSLSFLVQKDESSWLSGTSKIYPEGRRVAGCCVSSGLFHQLKGPPAYGENVPSSHTWKVFLKAGNKMFKAKRCILKISVVIISELPNTVNVVVQVDLISFLFGV